eukprot:s3436_g7.t1
MALQPAGGPVVAAAPAATEGGRVVILVRMGLRHPSERTQALVAAMVTGMAGDFMEHDCSRQTGLLTTVKSVLKQRTTRARVNDVPIPGGYVEQLPSTFDALPAVMKQQIFPQGAIHPPVNLDPFWQAAATWPCRSTHTGVRMVRMQNQMAHAIGQPWVPQHLAALNAQAILGQIPAMSVSAGVNSSIPGFHLLPAGVEAAAAARAARQEGSQAAQLQSLMDRAREPAGPQAAASVSAPLALPAPPQPVSGNVDSAGLVGASTAPAEVVPVNIGSVPQVAAQERQVAADTQQLQLDQAVALLANAHYGAALDAVPPEETAMFKKPAGKGMRKPASAKKKGPLVTHGKRKTDSKKEKF